MRSYKTEEIRNISLLGSSGAGKTTLAEAMLFESGVIKRRGDIASGNTVCDYFILCNGSSNTQVSAISGAIQKVVSQAEGHQHPWHVEGEANAEWVLIDYVDVVVHIFQTKIREHYDLEGLWGDAKIINLETNY